jgi:hypothetical protein
MSTYFHAHCEGNVDKCAELLLSLTREEHEAIATWIAPTKVTFDDGLELEYSGAIKETQVGFDARGRFCLDPEKAIAIGTLDMAWVVTFPDGRKVVYVGDIKKTQWTTLDGPDSLQLNGYGFALAAREGADAYCCGIWIAEEGRWVWGELVDLMGTTAATLWERVKHAAQNQGGEYRTGGHCRSCWSRMRCPAHLVPLDVTEALAPLGGHEVTEEKVLEFYLLAKRAEDTVKVALDFCHEYARRQGLHDASTGKKLMAVQCAGRESVNKEALLKEYPDARERGVFKKGQPYEQMRWVKA